VIAVVRKTDAMGCVAHRVAASEVDPCHYFFFYVTTTACSITTKRLLYCNNTIDIHKMTSLNCGIFARYRYSVAIKMMLIVIAMKVVMNGYG